MTILRGPADADHYRVKVGRFHDRWYADPLPGDDIAPTTDDAWPSVSTVKKASGADWSLVAMKRVANALEHDPHELDDLPYDMRYERLKAINKLGLARAMARGTNVHTYFEDGLRGRDILALPGEPGEEYIPAVRAFFDTYQPELVAAELVCIHRDLNGMGYGGTGDAIIRIDGRRYWVDWKSRGEDSDHGAYPEEAAQVAAYAGADYVITDGPARALTPEFDGGLIVSIKPDGVRIYPVDLPKAWQHWVALHAWWTARRTEHEPIGKPWAPRNVATSSTLSTITDLVGLEQVITNAVSVNQLTALWQANKATWTLAHTAAAKARRAELEAVAS